MRPPAPAAILETALYAADLEAAAGFYGGLVGLAEIGRAPGRHIFYRVGSGILLIFNPAATEIPSGGLPVPTHGARGRGHVCFAATRDEIALWRAVFAAAGVAIDAEFDWPGGARSLYVRDPAGNSVEFAESRLWDDTPPP
ncbi:MAG: VOC family protein [Rhodobacteraceae bacterium]|jgi:catechol 2,3-dioxygenase-like lactoylglutathione lyase family enzyme|nr:VOC family protein [Paracoccaceae bacterium]